MVHVPRWSILCRVVDHYGDAGVCWRLARQLAREYNIDVTLYIDDTALLARLVPALDATRPTQCVERVTVLPLNNPCTPPPAEWPNVIIDAFGGGLPASWLHALTLAFPPGSPKVDAPHWIVLEYLSAEPWVETMHARASPPPAFNVPRHFFFPGFTSATGGLLREAGVLAARDTFQRIPATRQAFLERLGVGLDIFPPPPEALLVSLFCYDTPALPALLDTWAASPQPIVCLLPESVAPYVIATWRCRHDVRNSTIPNIYGALTLHALPFLPQIEFDRLLWACDLNFVRGEDSFVRAQWAARPFIWQAYRQAEQAHLPKIDAFLARYLTTTPELPEAAKDALARFTRAWNDTLYADDITLAWRQLSAQQPALLPAAVRWMNTQSALPDLARQLIDFTIPLPEKNSSGL